MICNIYLIQKVYYSLTMCHSRKHPYEAVEVNRKNLQYVHSPNEEIYAVCRGGNKILFPIIVSVLRHPKCINFHTGRH